MTNGVEYEGAYRAKDKDLLRALARDLEQKDPWVLLSRPMKEADGFVEQSLSERASERRARKVSYILLGVALLLSLIHILLKKERNFSSGVISRPLFLSFGILVPPVIQIEVPARMPDHACCACLLYTSRCV